MRLLAIFVGPTAGPFLAAMTSSSGCCPAMRQATCVTLPVPAPPLCGFHEFLDPARHPSEVGRQLGLERGDVLDDVDVVALDAPEAQVASAPLRRFLHDVKDVAMLQTDAFPQVADEGLFLLVKVCELTQKSPRWRQSGRKPGRRKLAPLTLHLPSHHYDFRDSMKGVPPCHVPPGYRQVDF